MLISASMVSRGTLASWLLWLALLGSLSAAAAAVPAANTTAAAAVQADTAAQQAAPHNSTSKTVGFYIDEGYFLEGDTEILRAYIAGKQLVRCPGMRPVVLVAQQQQRLHNIIEVVPALDVNRQ
jgi:hypothetical protein